ncbi:MAG TPA: EAL domain-containing protein [Baekduia sp.]|uniref:EAL domain-containing protein n=1 Tax=Baekduia sp. TaxID=2600305 RepID=UPI002D786516|nr:EAL domain-containing protein [Baekduia sp.]HET6509735.1 EAL domain-containing protein [Baekduia sp.]
MPLHHAPTTDDAWSSLLGPAADATTEGLAVIDASATIRASNRAARLIAGVHTPERDRLAGRGPHDASFLPRHADGRPMTAEEQPGGRAIATGRPVRDEQLLVRRHDGTDQWLRVNAVPLLADGEDVPYGAVVSFTDITSFVEARAQLEARERELALLATHAGDLIARHDPTGKIVYAAGGAEALLGFPAAHLIGFWAADVCHPDDAPAVQRAHEHARRGISSTVQYRITNVRDGREMWLESTVSPILDVDGGFVEAVTTTRDITARKADEHRLREAEERARAAAEDARRQQALLEEAQNMAQLGSWSGDLITGEQWWSPAMYRLLGVPEDQPIRVKDHGRLIHQEDRQAVRDALARAAVDGEPFDVTYRLIRTDGEERIMHGRGAPAERLEDGSVRRVWGTTQDITDRHRLESGRREAEARLRAAFEHAPIGVCVVSLHGADTGRWLTVNPALAAMLGFSQEALLAQRIAAVVHPDELEAGRARIAALRRGTEERLSTECRMVDADGKVVWTLLTVAAVPDADGRPAYAIAQIVDITERKRFEGQLQHLADHDALTGLFNRRRFEEELDRALAAAERYGRRGAVLVLDLDGFKYVNDTLGHPVGDELIARLAATLRAELRETDVIARLGGDEFGVILPEATDDEAGAVAAKLLRAVARDGVVADSTRQARVTASIGMAPFDGADGLSPEELLVEADIAMYDAKEAGRNQAARATREQAGPGRHVSRLSWLERIRSALAEDRFELHAQPIVALGEGDDDPAFELLLRMRSDSGELVPPATFLPIAERFDLIGAIDRWVVARAVALVRAHPVTLSVNLSGRTMGDADFARWLEELLTATPVPPGRLIVEITETAAIVNLERARALADALRRLGCRLALDDFGAGFASFAYLKHLRFDVLKIDGEFVRGLRDNPTDRLVVEAVVQIARGLGTPSLAEFVGDDDTLDAVRALGVDYAQGFHLGRPVPVDEALAAVVAR